MRDKSAFVIILVISC